MGVCTGVEKDELFGLIYIYINDKYMQFQVSLQKLRQGCVKANEDISLC